MRKTLKLCRRCADNLRDIRGLVLYRVGWERSECPVCKRKAICDEYTAMKGVKRNALLQKRPL